MSARTTSLILPTSLSPAVSSVSSVAIAHSPGNVAPTSLQSSVTFVLDGSPRRILLMQQLLWMRLEGLSISAIARALQCDTETVQGVIDLWQLQTAQAQLPLAISSQVFEPLAVCPRREAGRRKKTTQRSRPLPRLQPRSRNRSEKILQ